MPVCELPQIQYRAGQNKGPCVLVCSVEMSQLITQLIIRKKVRQQIHATTFAGYSLLYITAN